MPYDQDKDVENDVKTGFNDLGDVLDYLCTVRARYDSSKEHQHQRQRQRRQTDTRQD